MADINVGDIQNKRRAFSSKAALICTLGIILFFYLFVFLSSENVPFDEDHYYSISTVRNHQKTLDGVEIFPSVWEEVSSKNRAFAVKLATLADYTFFGKIDMRHLIVWGNLMLLGLWLLLYRSFGQRDLTLFLPVTMLLFTPVVLSSNWAFATFTYTHLLFFVFASLFFLHKKGWINTILAAVFGVLATFTHDWGVWVFPIGILLTVMPNLRKTQLGFWVLAGVLTASLYFFILPYEADFKIITNNLTQYPDRVISDFFVVLGSPFKVFLYQPLFAGIAGLSLLVGIGFLFRQQKLSFRQYPLKLSFLSFLLISILLIVLNTSSADIIIDSLSDEYQLFPILFWIILFLIIVEIFDTQYISKWLIVGLGALFFFARLDYYIPKMKAHDLHAEALLFKKFHYLPEYEGKVSGKTINQKLILKNAMNEGYYTPSEEIFPQAIKIRKKFKTNHPRLVVKGRVLKSNDYQLELSGWAFMKHEPDKRQHIFLALESKKHKYIIPHNAYLPFMPRPKLTKSKGYKPESAFSFAIPKSMIDVMPGEYKVGVAVQIKGQYSVVFMEQTAIFE